MNCESVVVRQANDNLATITAGAGQDGQAQTGIVTDLSAIGYPEKVTIHIMYKAALSNTETLSFTAQLQTSAAVNMGSPSDLYLDAAPVVAQTGSATNTAPQSSYKVVVSLAKAKRYIRLKYTPDLSKSGTDTVILSAIYVFDEPEYGPQL